MEANAITVMGARSCGDCVKQKPVGEENNWSRVIYEAWLVGYLSGMASGSRKDALKGSTASSFFVWMDNYCQVNPLDDIEDGGFKLFAGFLKRKGL
jgi:hypothetical protein